MASRVLCAPDHPPLYVILVNLMERGGYFMLCVRSFWNSGKYLTISVADIPIIRIFVFVWGVEAVIPWFLIFWKDIFIGQSKGFYANYFCMLENGHSWRRLLHRREREQLVCCLMIILGSQGVSYWASVSKNDCLPWSLVLGKANHANNVHFFCWFPGVHPMVGSHSTTKNETSTQWKPLIWPLYMCYPPRLDSGPSFIVTAITSSDE